MIGQTQHDDFESEGLETGEMSMGTTTGASTSAVSRIFNEGAFSDSNKRRYMILGGVIGAVLLVFGIAYFMLGTDDEMADIPLDPTEEIASEEGEMPMGEEGEEGVLSAEGEEGVVPEGGEDLGMAMEGIDMAGMGGIGVIMPADGQSRDYDETMGEAMFQWEGAADFIMFARDSGFLGGVTRINVAGMNSFNFTNPQPGTWYWRLESADQTMSSPVSMFTVAGTARRNIALAEPTEGGTISDGGTVTWSGDEKVSFYRVELTTGGFANPNYRFSTTGMTAQLNGVMAGAYRLRVGGFSEVSGQWEYTQPISVNVQ